MRDPVFMSVMPFDPVEDAPDPKFLKLSSLSQIIDLGDPGSPVVDDINNDPRPIDLGFDPGADEYASCLAEVHDSKPLRTYGRIQDAVDSVDSFTVGGAATIRVAGHCRLISGNNLIAINNDQHITFSGGWNADFTEQDYYVYRTTLDGRGLGRVLKVYSGTNVTINSGFTLQSGYAGSSNDGGNGGGIYVEANATLTVQGIVKVYTNTAAANGGGIYNQGELTIYAPAADDYVSIIDNHANNGGGIYNDTQGQMTLWSNPAYLLEYMLIAVNHNTADNDGGGIYNNAASTANLRSNSSLHVDYNTAGDNGGGIYNAGAQMNLHDPAVMSISYNNTVNNGGGIYNASSAGLEIKGVDDASFNTAQNGGGIYNAGTLLIENHRNQGNIVTGQGGGLYSSAVNDLQLTNVYFFDNEAAGNGGGIYTDHDQTTVLHNTIRNNRSTGGDGGGVYDASNTFILNGTLVISNSATSGNGGIHSTAGTTDIDYNDYYLNTTPVSNVGLGSNYQTVDPDFTWQFIIDVDSPVIDHGDPQSGVAYYGTGGLTFDVGGWWTLRPGTDVGKSYLGIGLYNDPGVHEVKIDYNVELCHFGLSCWDPKEYIKEISIDPEETAVFTHTLHNTGDVTDTFDIVITSSTGIAQLLTPGPFILPSSVSTYVVVSVTAPPYTPPETPWDKTTVTAYSRNSQNPNTSAYLVKDTLYDYTNVNRVIRFELAPPYVENALPGQTLTLTHFVTNTGNVSDTVTIGFDPPQYGETKVYNDRGKAVAKYGIFLSPGASKQFTITYRAPDWLSPGALEEFNVTAVSDADSTVQTGVPDKITILAISGTRHVSLTGDDANNNCTSAGPVPPPCRTLEHALAMAADGDLIKVAQGTYTTTMTVGSQTALLYLEQAQSIVGGYSDEDWSVSRPLSQPTILDAQGTGRVVYVTGTNSITLDGLHLTGGVGNGAAVYNNGASLTLLANAIHHNTTGDGNNGAIYNNSGSLTMRNNTLYNNSQSGLYLNGGTNIVENNTFYGNMTSSEGGSSGQGGAIHHESGSLTARNNIFDNNQADAGNNGGAIYAAAGATIDTNLFNDNGSNVNGGAGNTNPINANPHLLDPDNGNFHLLKGAAADPNQPNPAEDAALDIGLTEDFERDVRPQGTGYDLGADERLHVPDVQVEPNHSTSNVAFNTLIVYTHTITNTGEDADVFTITHSSSLSGTLGWTADFSQLPNTVALNPGQSRVVTLSVTSGGAGSGGTQDITVITATSRNGYANAQMTVLDTAVNTTTVFQTHGLTFYPNRAKTVSPGQSITYSHTLSNTGNGPDTFTFQALSSHGWTTTTPPTATLPALSSTTVIVSLAIPATAAGEVDIMRVTATSSISPAFHATVTDTTTISGTPVVTYRGVRLSSNMAKAEQPGRTLHYTHTLENLGNINDVFTITAASGQGWNLSVTPSGPIALNAFGSASVGIQLTVPATAISGTLDVTVITATSIYSAAIADTVVDTTTVITAPQSITRAVSFEPDNAKTVLANLSVYYTHTLKNTGNTADTFSFTSSSSQGWTLTLSPAGPINLDAGESAEVQATLAVPAGVSAGTVDLSVITATSAYSQAVFDTVTNTTTITDVQSVSLSLTPPFSSSMQSPGNTVVYRHTLRNTGNGNDTFTLNFASSQTWGSLQPLGPLTLGPGQGAPITVSVAIPAGAGNGITDLSVLTATSGVDTGVFKTAVDTTTAHLEMIYLPIILKNYTPPTPTNTPPAPTATPTATGTTAPPTATSTTAPPTATGTTAPTATPTTAPTATPTASTGPDLIITGITYNAGAQTATITVRNQGNQPATTWFFVDLYINRAPTSISDLGDYYGTAPTSGLAVGASTDIVIDNLSLTAGTQLYGQADTYDGGNGSPDYGMVQEMNENNNVFGPSPVAQGQPTGNNAPPQPSVGSRATPTPAQ